MGGEHSNSFFNEVMDSGSSPRGRGTHAPLLFKGNDFWIIPAWAGNTSRALAGSLSGADHPRVGGEHWAMSRGWPVEDGSSPRGRGTHTSPHGSSTDSRIIPAWAGNTLASRPRRKHTPDHPRVGGEHAKNPTWISLTDGSSPRGRGTLGQSASKRRIVRIIPAWAGNT